MPGIGILDFADHAAAIAQAGIYDLAIHHEQILVGVVLRRWKIDTLTGLDADAAAARDRVIDHIERVGRIARRFVERRSEVLATAAGSRRLAVVGGQAAPNSTARTSTRATTSWAQRM